MTTTPEQDRELRRTTIRAYLDGNLTPAQFDGLRKHVDLELAHADRERAAHEEHRHALATALGLVPGTGWDAILDCATKTRSAAKDRAAALQDARDALADAGQPTDSNGWLFLAPAIRALVSEVKLLRGNSEVDRREAGHRRTRLATALKWDTATSWDDLIKAAAATLRDAKRAEKRCEDLRGESLRRGKEVVERNEKIAGLEQRAEQAEAALNRVWDLADRWEHALAPDLLYARALRAALDGKQPATKPEPEPDGLYLRLCRMLGVPADTPDDDLIETVRGLLVRDARQQATATAEPEPDAEPELIPVLDYAVRQVFAFARRIAKESRS